jgi:hypothetical protein
LHKAILVLKHLRKENQQLTRNFDNVRKARKTCYLLAHVHCDLEGHPNF